MFGLTMHEGAAVLGEAPVNADGSWLADVPPYLPIHLQPIDKFGLSIRSQGTLDPGACRARIAAASAATRAARARAFRPSARTRRSPSRRAPADAHRADPGPHRVSLGQERRPDQELRSSRSSRPSARPVPQRHDERQQAADVLHGRDAPTRSRARRAQYQIPRFDLCGLTATSTATANRSPSTTTAGADAQLAEVVRLALLPVDDADEDGHHAASAARCLRCGPSRPTRAAPR